MKKNDLEGLLILAKVVTETKNKFQSNFNERYFNKIDEARSKGTTWNKRFLWLYVVGSIFIGVRWMFVDIFCWPSKWLYRGG